MDRRTVVRGAGAALGAMVVGGCSSGATESSPRASATTSPGRSAGVLASLADIEVGSAIAARSPEGTPLLIVRTSETTAAGFSAVCPHQRCTVGSSFVCPCHGSRFESTTGKVIGGPARRDLDPYPVRVADGTVVPA